MLSDSQKKEIVSGLEAAVEEFNRAFQAWMEKTGCRANFGWSYGPDRQLKALQILDIDAMVYKRPDPRWAKENTLKEVLEKAQPTD